MNELLIHFLMPNNIKKCRECGTVDQISVKLNQKFYVLTISLSYLAQRISSTCVHHTTPMWHFIFIWIFHCTVVVDGVDNSQIKQQSIQYLDVAEYNWTNRMPFIAGQSEKYQQTN